MINKRQLSLDGSISALLLGLGLAMVGPYAGLEFSSEPWNNDYIYMSLARMFREQPWSWNALQYCGTSVASIYPPLFPLLMAAVPVSIGHAYHLVSAVGYALVPVSLYVFSVQLFQSRFAASFAAMSYSLLASPIYLLSVWRTLASGYHYAPWGFVTLMSYSEAGHTFALALELFALAAAWRNSWRLAAFIAGAVFLFNWPGIIGLLLGLAAVAVAKIRELGWFEAAARTFGTAGIGYGLSAFWMTPSVFTTTTLLDRIVLRPEEQAAPWNTTTYIALVIGFAMLAFALYRRTPVAVRYLLASASLLGAVVVTFSLARNYLLPLPHRYVMEWNITLVLAIAWLTTIGKKWRIAVVVATVMAGGWGARGFLVHPWTLQPAPAEADRMPAFQIADWLQRNASSVRVFTSGELDGSLNALSRVAQVGGTRQGVSNPLILAAQRQVSYGCTEHKQTARVNQLWLRALDARFVVVHDATSREHFHWFVQPEAFSSFPVAWTNHAGDTIYAVPPPDQRSAVVVDMSKLRNMPRMQSTADLVFLEAYVSWAQGVRPAQLRWSRTDAGEIEADVGNDEAILVKINYDRGWRSPGNAVRPDPIGFLLIEPKSGAHQRVMLGFGAPWDMRVGRAITLLTIGLLLMRVRSPIIAALAIVPAAAVYFYLMAHLPDRVLVAERSFRLASPPIINPGGVIDMMPKRARPPDGQRAIAIYGSNFGEFHDTVKVLVGGKEGTVIYRSPNQVNVDVPAGTPERAQIRVEANGCQGNAFLLEP